MTELTEPKSGNDEVRAERNTWVSGDIEIIEPGRESNADTNGEDGET